MALDFLRQQPPSPIPSEALAAPSSAQPASPFSTSLSSEPGSSQGQSLPAYALSSAHPFSPQPLYESEDFWEPTSLDRPQPLPEPSPSSPAPGHPGPASSVAVRNPRNLQEVDKNPCEWEGSWAPGPPPALATPSAEPGPVQEPTGVREDGDCGRTRIQFSLTPHPLPPSQGHM